MKVLFIGTGNAFASGGRNTMAILLRARGRGLLLDCGPATLPAMKRLGCEPSDVDTVLLSHLHGDHFAGVPFLVLHEIYESPRQAPLRILGPPGAKTAIESATTLFYPGLPRPEFELDVRELSPDAVETVAPFQVQAFEVDHFSSGVAFGYRVEVGGRSVVFSGDTAWTHELARHTQGADLFICECSSYATSLPRHMSHQDLESNRSSLGAERVLLVHPGEDVLAHETGLAFELAYDGMEVTL